MKYKICPNCNKKLDGLLTSRYIVTNAARDFINSLNATEIEAFCSDCGGNILSECISKLDDEKNNLTKSLSGNLHIIPIVTTNYISNWDYDPIGIVSAQSVTGTGMLSEISSSWADLIGGQSDSLSNKIMNGENLCKDKIRFNCLMLGGNAIIATDIDYSEVGGTKGMLMVCMSGTAVNVKTWSSNFAPVEENISELTNKVKRMKELTNIKVPSLM